MDTNELLTELDTFPRPGIQSYEGALEDATRLIRAAAVTIRQLRTAENDLASLPVGSPYNAGW